MTDLRLLRRLLQCAVLTAFCVIVLGAWVRLNHAGLGCPDWPGCYGHLTWPVHPDDIARANAAFPERAVEVPKAWREMVHRFLAGALGLMVLALAWIASGQDAFARRAVIASGALAAAAIGWYTLDWRTFALIPAGLAIALPMAAAARLPADVSRRTLVFVFGLIVFQALLGKWTVTLQLKPIIVTAHLLGGMATFALLVWALLCLGQPSPVRPPVGRGLALAALGVVIAQIFLGGWTSTNYAALSCPDFPTCTGRWWPQTDFRAAFTLVREIGVNYEGGILDATARATIHHTHRVGALIVLLVVGALIVALLRSPSGRGLGVLVGALLTLQIALGISNVVYDLPLSIATAHNGVAALLLGSLLVVLARTRREPIR
jgi:cytochrome c oxidase assembly protein subunit 15